MRRLLWKALKTAVDLRDGGICQKCGRAVQGADSHMSHVYRQGRCGRLKFDLENVKTLCADCHRGWWHNNEAEGGVWFAETYPERWDYLQQRLVEYRQAGTIPMSWYQDRLEELRQYIVDHGGIVDD